MVLFNPIGIVFVQGELAGFPHPFLLFGLEIIPYGRPVPHSVHKGQQRIVRQGFGKIRRQFKRVITPFEIAHQLQGVSQAVIGGTGQQQGLVAAAQFSGITSFGRNEGAIRSRIKKIMDTNVGEQ